MQSSSTRSIALCGLSVALLAVGAFITVPLGPIPFTLQSMMLLIIINILTPREAIAAVGVYLLLGVVGLPVGAGFRGGLAWLFGPTGGFLLGFLLAAILVGLLRRALVSFGKTPQSVRGNLILSLCVAMLTWLSYSAVGLLWFAFVSSISIEAAFLACVLPFVATDVIKAAVAISCVQPVLLALGRAPWLAAPPKAAKP
jgi:biotin transport system substrate-specific component